MPRESLIQIRQGTDTEWLFANPILASGEPGFDISNNILKVGNGIDRWNVLLPIGSGNTVVIQPSKNYISVNDHYTALNTDDIIFVNTEIKAINITLPTALGLGGKQLTIKKTTGSNILNIITDNTEETIDGKNSINISYNYESINIVSDNTNWFIL